MRRLTEATSKSRETTDLETLMYNPNSYMRITIKCTKNDEEIFKKYMANPTNPLTFLEHDACDRVKSQIAKQIPQYDLVASRVKITFVRFPNESKINYGKGVEKDEQNGSKKEIYKQGQSRSVQPIRKRGPRKGSKANAVNG